jgi:hypothetical protein
VLIQSKYFPLSIHLHICILQIAKLETGADVKRCLAVYYKKGYSACNTLRDETRKKRERKTNQQQRD